MIAHVPPQPEPDPMAMPHTVPWTRKDLDRLPDDGNRYELLDGELLVTPTPSDAHQEIADWLNNRLTPFVATSGLGFVRHPRSVIVVDGSQLEPDLMVRPVAPLRGWEKAPLPILVIEILSAATRRRDLREKRDFYMEKGIPEYWVVDRYLRSVVRIKPESAATLTSTLTWAPDGTDATLGIDLVAMFAETQADVD